VCIEDDQRLGKAEGWQLPLRADSSPSLASGAPGAFRPKAKFLARITTGGPRLIPTVQVRSDDGPERASSGRSRRPGSASGGAPEWVIMPMYSG
jgi:hypothetical protein